MQNLKGVQLNKYLANLGITSRRKVEELVSQGRVTINRQKVTKIATRINPDKDKVQVDGKDITRQHFVYIILNKPRGVVSTVSDEFKRKTVLDLVKVKERIYPVGRLDQESHGLILLTNDGEVANLLTHPRYHISKTYEVLVSGEVRRYQLEKLKRGVYLRDGKTAPAEVEVLEKNPGKTLLKIILHEGKNRQIRRMCGVLGLNVLDLKRVAMGEVKLGDLEAGKYRYLTEEELGRLRS